MIGILKKLSLKSKRKGSATVEAAMIFPLIMFIMFGIIYLTIIHYQNNVMIAESIRAMNRAGAYWQYVDMNKNGEHISYSGNNVPTAFDSKIGDTELIKLEMIKKRNAYRTIIDILSDEIQFLFDLPLGHKKTNTKQYVDARIAGVKFKQFVEKEESAEWYKGADGEQYSNASMFFGNDLKVDIGRSYINPLIGLSKMFLGSNSVMEKVMKKSITVSGVISNQAEFVRNLDTVYDIGINPYKLTEPY